MSSDSSGGWVRDSGGQREGITSTSEARIEHAARISPRKASRRSRSMVSLAVMTCSRKLVSYAITSGSNSSSDSPTSIRRNSPASSVRAGPGEPLRYQRQRGGHNRAAQGEERDRDQRHRGCRQLDVAAAQVDETGDDERRDRGDSPQQRVCATLLRGPDHLLGRQSIPHKLTGSAGHAPGFSRLVGAHAAGPCGRALWA